MSHQIPRRAAVGFAVVGAACAACTRYGAPTAQPDAEAAAKMLVLRARTPDWTLPVLGGAVFTGLTALWLTASVWFFTTSGLTF